MERQAKDAAIGEIKARFDKMTAAVFLDFKGMTVEHVTKLRAEFRKAGVEYKVVKNTLVKQALKESAYNGKLNDVRVPCAPPTSAPVPVDAIAVPGLPPPVPLALTPGVVPTVGNSEDRATRTAARACSYTACACNTF